MYSNYFLDKYSYLCLYKVIVKTKGGIMIELVKRQDDFNGVKWVLLAISKKPDMGRPTNLVFFDGKFFVGTDEHRVHVYRPVNTEYEVGLYKVVGNTASGVKLEIDKDNDGKFPDWKALSPKGKIKKIVEVSSLSTEWAAYAKIVRGLDERFTVQYKFIEDVLKFENPMTFYSTAADWLMLGKGERRLALIALWRI